MLNNTYYKHQHEPQINTYLVQLYFFQATVSLLLVLHVKDLYQLKSNYPFVSHTPGFEHVREFALSNQLQDLEAVDLHAYVEHHILLRIRLLVFRLLVHLGFACDISLFSLIFVSRHIKI